MIYVTIISKCQGHKCTFTRDASRAYKQMNSSTVPFTLNCNHSHVNNTFEQAEGINVIHILLILMYALRSADMNKSISCICHFYLFVFQFIHKMMKACPSKPLSDEHYIHEKIMLQKTKVFNTKQLCCLVLDSQHLRTSGQYIDCVALFFKLSFTG